MTDPLIAMTDPLITVRYFASLREALGASESVPLADGSTLGQCLGMPAATADQCITQLAQGDAVGQRHRLGRTQGLAQRGEVAHGD